MPELHKGSKLKEALHCELQRTAPPPTVWWCNYRVTQITKDKHKSTTSVLYVGLFSASSSDVFKSLAGFFSSVKNPRCVFGVVLAGRPFLGGVATVLSLFLDCLSNCWMMDVETSWDDFVSLSSRRSITLEYMSSEISILRGVMLLLVNRPNEFVFHQSDHNPKLISMNG